MVRFNRYIKCVVANNTDVSIPIGTIQIVLKITLVQLACLFQFLNGAIGTQICYLGYTCMEVSIPIRFDSNLFEATTRTTIQQGFNSYVVRYNFIKEL